MVKFRLLILAVTLLVLATFGSLSIYYARGYRLGFQKNQISLSPQGILTVTSSPSGAEVYVDGNLKMATDNNISLLPGVYEVKVTKDGYKDWKKTLVIEKEIVTPAHAFLVASAPSLTALTFSGAQKPVMAPDFSKVAFIIQPDTENGVELSSEGKTKAGLWVVELTDLPLGFSRDPRQITDGDLAEASLSWSPDGDEILLNLGEENYLLKVSEFTAEEERVDVTKTLDEIAESWAAKEEKALKSRLTNLNNELEVIMSSMEDVRFSPDGDKILYSSKQEIEIPEGLVEGLPGSSTQRQERRVKAGKTYVYDIKEDRNFLVGEGGEIVYWLPNSHNVLIPNEGRILIKDYDGTNEQVVFSGNYVFPYAFPSNSLDKILILTSFGDEGSPSNLYWVGLK
jgi:hypothetical protein